MKKIVLYIICYILSINLYASQSSNDSLKIESIQKEMMECMNSLNNRTDYTSDAFLKKTIRTARRLDELANSYYSLTKDSTVYILSFMGEFFTAAIYKDRKMIDSAYIHSLKIYQLYEPYGRMICLSDTTGQWARYIFGNEGIYGIMREWNVNKGNLNEAIKYGTIIADSCKAINAEIEVVKSLKRNGEICKQFNDYENSIRLQVEALDTRLQMRDYQEYPAPSVIYADILSTLIDWDSWVKKQYNNESLRESLQNFSNTYMKEFLDSHSSDFCQEEEKVGNIESVSRLFNVYIELLDLVRKYDTFFEIENGIDDFYIRNYGKESIYFANWLLRKEDIYSKYVSHKGQFVEFYQAKANSFLKDATSIWDNYLVEHPIEPIIQKYQDIKKSLKTNNTLFSDYMSYKEILSSYYLYLSNQKKTQLDRGLNVDAINTIKKKILLSEVLEYDDESFLYSQLADIYESANEFGKAEKWYNKALDIATEKRDTIEMARANWSIYNLYTRQNNSRLAKHAIYQTYNLLNGTKARSIDKCIILISLAYYFNRNYNYKLALDLYSESILDLAILGMPIDDSDYITLAEYESAVFGKMTDTSVEELIRIAFKGDSSYVAQQAAYKLGTYYGSFTDDYEKAVSYLKKACKIAEHRNDTIALSKYLNEVGVVYHIEKKYKEAFEYMLESESVNRNSISENLISLMPHVNDINLVENRLQRSFDNSKRTITKQITILSSQGREQLIQEYLPIYMQYRSLPYYCHNSKKCSEVAYNSALLFKGLLLNTQKELSEIIDKTKDNELKKIYQKILELRVVNEQKSANGEKISTNITIEIEKLETELVSKLAKKKLYSFSDISWEDVKKRLKDNEVAIEICEINNLEPLNHTPICYGALILRKDYESPIFVELGSKEKIDELIVTISSTFNKEAKMSYEKWDIISKKLYSLLWGRIDKYLKDGDDVFFSLDGTLHKAPVELFSDNEGRAFNTKYNVFRLSSTRELCKKRKEGISSAILYGGLQYDATLTGQVVDSLDAFVNCADSTARSGWKYLPASAEEVDSISNILISHGITAIKKKGLDGTEESFRELSGTKYSIVHLATHGFYFPAKEVNYLDYYQTKNHISPMKRSGLMLAGGQTAWMGTRSIEQEHDGILTSEEIAAVDFSNVSMVVLSACQTGLGDIDTGAEGVIGIQRAFKLAGVQSLLMSLWKVDDNATSYMMQRFYSRMLSGETKHNAFKAAQQEVRYKYPNPYYWAGFVMLD